MVPLSKWSWQWLIMKAEDPSTGEIRYFLDKCLPFGVSISCALFQKFSDALKFLTEYRTAAPKSVTNYLDDFLFIATTLLRCNYLMREFILLCDELGIPITEDKTEWATLRVIFLGILLDGVSLTLGIPLEKRTHALNLLYGMINKKKAMVRDLQSLCGYLNFLNMAIFPGRIFTRRMYAKFSNVLNAPGSFAAD